MNTFLESLLTKGRNRIVWILDCRDVRCNRSTCVRGFLHLRNVVFFTVLLKSITCIFQQFRDIIPTFYTRVRQSLNVSIQTSGKFNPQSIWFAVKLRSNLSWTVTRKQSPQTSFFSLSQLFALPASFLLLGVRDISV